MKINKHIIYISLFAVLYLITAGSSFVHAISFFGLANNSWMSLILAFAFELGQAVTLFSLLTSQKDRNRIMPWVLMTMFTLVQVIGNVFSSYKHIINNSIENLRYFKEPIFIWTDLPDQEATVIVTWAIGAILPIAALLITSMITNYLTDIEELKNQKEEASEAPMIINEENPLINQNSILQMENQGLQESLDNKDKELDSLKEELKSKQELIDSQNQKINDLDKENQELVKEKFDKEPEDLEKHNFNEDDDQGEIRETDLEEDGQNNEEGIEGNEREEDKSNNIKPESAEKIINEEDKKDEFSNDEESVEEDQVIDENVKVADALMGGNILTKYKKDSHFINKP